MTSRSIRYPRQGRGRRKPAAAREKEHGKFPSFGMGYSVAGITVGGVALELHALFLRVEYATVIVITSVIPAVVEKPGSVILAIPPRVVSVDRWFVTNFGANHSGTGMDVVTVNF